MLSKKTFNSRMGKGTGKLIGFKYRNSTSKPFILVSNQNTLRLCLSYNYHKH